MRARKGSVVSDLGGRKKERKKRLRGWLDLQPVALLEGGEMGKAAAAARGGSGERIGALKWAARGAAGARAPQSRRW